MPNDNSSLNLASEPAATVEAINRAARKVRTPCGDGSMVWRVWGAGEPLIMFHGGSGSWTHWIRNIPELSKHYELWAADIPGLGDSAMPPKPWVPQTIAEVVVAGIDSQFSPDVKLRMAGFSFGGQIAGLSAAALGDRVARLTLIGVAALGLRADPREPFAKRRTGMSPQEIAAVFRQNLEVLMFADPANIDALAVHLQAENINRARFRSRPFAATDTLARALEHVTARLGTIWGIARYHRAPVDRYAPGDPASASSRARRAPHRGRRPLGRLRGGRPIQRRIPRPAARQLAARLRRLVSSSPPRA